MNSRQLIIALIIIVLVAIAALFLTKSSTTTTTDTNDTVLPVESDGGIGDGAEPLDETVEDADSPMVQLEGEEVIGMTINEQDIVAHHFGTGEQEILFVGGVHGGYSKNTAAVALELISYLEDNANAIPDGVRVTVIPELNPDGLANTDSAAYRFNANKVDINRNFDCEWSTDAVWRDQKVGAGTEPFSEPEARALRDYVQSHDIAAAVVWFSAEGKVYPSACEGTPSQTSVKLAATFATAAGYPAAAEFDAYAITGDMVNWMAKEGVPAISVLLSDHQSTEWEKNKLGVEAVLKNYAQ